MTVIPVVFGLGAFGVWYARWCRRTPETLKGATAWRVVFGTSVSMLGAAILMWDLYSLSVALEVLAIVFVCLGIPGVFMFLEDYWKDKENDNGWVG